MAKYKVYKNPHNNYREKVKDGFNWWVLLFGPFWYLFKGFIGKAILWFIVALVVGSFTVGIGAIIVWLICAFKANKALQERYLSKGWEYLGYEDELNKKREEK